ncbi:flavin monoamine oxidase family protein [Bradyrhizobium sp.]
MSSNGSDTEILDVAVVGAGVSGVYSAWRLASSRGSGAGICVFETGTRIGGRLLSVTPPGIPNARVELGGMRFMKGHTRVEGLLQHLDIAVHPFTVGDPQNICYVRGRRLRHQDLKTPALIPYMLLPDEQTALSLDKDFVAVAAERVLRSMRKKDDIDLAEVNWDIDLAEVNWREVAQTKSYEGDLLRDLPLHYLLQRNVSDEALRFADDISGYNSILHTWNAADGFPWNLDDFGKDVKYFGIPSGYASLPTKIACLFEKAGGGIQTGHRLESFDVRTVNGSDFIEMQFAVSETTSFDVLKVNGSDLTEMQFAVGETSKRTIRARNLILAMPRQSIELLAKSGAVLANQRVRELIGSVTPIPLFKLALCYPFPWWKTIDPVPVATDPGGPWRKICKGASITDLPVRQCYYWPTDEETGNAVVLIYDDGRDREYWTELRKRRQGEDDYAAVAAEPGDPQWEAHPAPELMVREVHRQLLEMHGVQHRNDIPKPYAAAYRDWSGNPYGGGANFWHLHVDSEQVARDILQPKPHVRVFVCGEAYSHQQGWVEGALRTADEMLFRHFGLELPSWS